jgi:hypothetical protein
MESAPGDCEPELPQATASPSFANYYSRPLAHRPSAEHFVGGKHHRSRSGLTNVWGRLPAGRIIAVEMLRGLDYIAIRTGSSFGIAELSNANPAITSLFRLS